MGKEDFVGNVPIKDGDTLTTIKMNITKITLSNAPIDIAVDCVAPQKYGDAGTYDLSSVVDISSKADLVLDLNNMDELTLECDFSGVGDIEAVTAAECVTVITAAIVAAGYTISTLINPTDQTGTIRIDATDGPLGTTAVMIFTGSLATALGINGTTNGTGDPSAFELSCLSFDGSGAEGARIAVKIYDAATAGSLLDDCQVQLVSKGTFISGENTNDAVLTPDSDGELDFEIVSDITGIDSLYIEVAQVSTGFLNETLAAREQIDKTA